MKYKIKHLWYIIRCWFNPRQKWLTSKIPNTYADKPYLIEEILIACIIDFVEQEKALEIIDWTTSDCMQMNGWRA